LDKRGEEQLQEFVLHDVLVQQLLLKILLMLDSSELLEEHAILLDEESELMSELFE